MSHAIQIHNAHLPGEKAHPVSIDIRTSSGVRLGSVNLSHGDEKLAERTAERWAHVPELLDFARDLRDRLLVSDAQGAKDRAEEIEAVLELCR